MKTTTVAIIGGTQSETYKKIGKKRGMNVEHHQGKTGGGCVEKAFRSIINKADVIIIIKDALKHQSMWAVRDLAEKAGKKYDFIDGRGATGALEKAAELLG